MLRRVGNLALREGDLERNPAANVGESMRRIDFAQATEARRPDAWGDRRSSGSGSGARPQAPAGPRAAGPHGLSPRRDARLDVARHGFRPTPDRHPPPDLLEHHFRPQKLPRAVGALASGPRGSPPADARRGRAGRCADCDGPVGNQPDGGGGPHNRAWKRLKERFPPLGIRRLRLHDFRHTWASLALRAGRNVRWVADVLGHASATFTLETYAHVLQDETPDLSFLPGFHSRKPAETRLLSPVSDDDEEWSDSEESGGARDRTRTGDSLLGKQGLYQLSYSRLAEEGRSFGSGSQRGAGWPAPSRPPGRRTGRRGPLRRRRRACR